MISQTFDGAFLPPLGQDAGENPAGDCLDDNGARVRDDRQPGEHQEDRDEPGAVALGHGVEPREGRSHDRPVERLEPTLRKGRVEGDRAGDEGDDNRGPETENLPDAEIGLHGP